MEGNPTRRAMLTKPVVAIFGAWLWCGSKRSNTVYLFAPRSEAKPLASPCDSKHPARNAPAPKVSARGPCNFPMRLPYEGGARPTSSTARPAFAKCPKMRPLGFF